MSGRCRFIELPFMVSEEYARAQSAFGLTRTLEDVAMAAVTEYNDNLTEMYHCLEAALAERGEKHVGQAQEPGARISGVAGEAHAAGA